VDEVPLAQRPLLSFDQQHALALQDQEVLLLILAVVVAGRLPRGQHADVEAKLREARVALKAGVRTPMTVEPLSLAGVQHEPALAARLESVFGALERRLGNHGFDYGG
jgi:hypothetical protein